MKFRRQGESQLPNFEECNLSRIASPDGAFLFDGVAGGLRHFRWLTGSGTSKPEDETHANQFQAPSAANDEELLRDQPESGCQGLEAAGAEDRTVKESSSGKFGILGSL